MLRYMTDDGQKIAAPSYKAVVEALRETSWSGAHNTPLAFMRAMAERVKTQSGAEIKCDTPENFVHGLLEIGYLKKDEDNG